MMECQTTMQHNYIKDLGFIQCKLSQINKSEEWTRIINSYLCLTHDHLTTAHEFHRPVHPHLL